MGLFWFCVLLCGFCGGGGGGLAVVEKVGLIYEQRPTQESDNRLKLDFELWHDSLI